ncbi:MAG: C/D box methylation guide ribonucleoprotein complex aNOP56 subunit [Candidatus Bathyarchaeota archaeon]|nr:C/D box methylation guide ribonucleoprotein complex aNOP56 subunit [Candidatus Bathyarchaeota archaeon]
MKALIIQFPFGVVAFDQQKKVVASVMFSKKPHAAAGTIAQLEAGKINQIAPLINQLQNSGYDTFVFDRQTLASEVNKTLNVPVEIMQPEDTSKIYVLKEQIAIETGFVKDATELSLWARNVSMELAKLQVKDASEKRDLIVGQSIQTLDDLDRTLNLFMGRLREWYGVHFPELDRLVEKHETYVRLVMNLGQKENFTAEALEKEGLPKNKIDQISNVAQSSMGADITETDLVQIQSLSKAVFDMYKLREDIENYLDKTMDEVAPNTKAIAGALLGARLIAIAGGLKNLAMRPASTLQVLGAEKALFRSIKTGARPPKHGLIFQHTLLHDAKRWQRGKIARAIAGKLSIAVRADAFGGTYVGDVLKASLDKRIEEIRQKYAEPPPIKEKPQKEQKAREFTGGRRDFRGDRRDRHWQSSKRGSQKWRRHKRADKS